MIINKIRFKINKLISLSLALARPIGHGGEPQADVSAEAPEQAPLAFQGTPQQTAAGAEEAAALAALVALRAPGLRTKLALNNHVMRQKGSPLTSGDIVYDSRAAQSGEFQVTVRLAVLGCGAEAPEFTGWLCRSKRDAEHAAAAVALGSICNSV